jgi:hypothetical protein
MFRPHPWNLASDECLILHRERYKNVIPRERRGYSLPSVISRQAASDLSAAEE